MPRSEAICSAVRRLSRDAIRSLAVGPPVVWFGRDGVSSWPAWHRPAPRTRSWPQSSSTNQHRSASRRLLRGLLPPCPQGQSWREPSARSHGTLITTRPHPAATVGRRGHRRSPWWRWSKSSTRQSKRATPNLAREDGDTNHSQVRGVFPLSSSSSSRRHGRGPAFFAQSAMRQMPSSKPNFSSYPSSCSDFCQVE